MQENRNISSKSYESFFAYTNRAETLSLRGLIERVAFEQSVYSRDIIEGVISRLTQVMVEQLTAGQAVKWPSLGTFKVEVENEKNGLVNIKTGNVREQIAGIHIRLIPEGSQGEDISSRAFADACSFQLDGVKVFTTVGSGDDAREVSSVVSMEQYRQMQGIPTLTKVFQGENQIGLGSEFNVGNKIQFGISGTVANRKEGSDYFVALVADNVHVGDTVLAGDNTVDAINSSFDGTIKALGTTAGQAWSRKFVLVEDTEVILEWSEFTGTAPNS